MQAEYSGLANQLGDYVVRLLDKVHGNEELNAILNASPDMEDTDDLLRLQLAIKLREKKVSHAREARIGFFEWLPRITTSV